MSGTTKIRPADCDPGALLSDEDPGGSFPSGPQNACVTAGHAAASASASARLSATAAASAAACVAVSPGGASEKHQEAAEAAGAVAEAAAVAEAKAEAATVAWLARAAAEDAAGPTPIIQQPPRPPGAQRLQNAQMLPKDVRELPTSKTSVYRQGKLVSDGARPNGVGVESEEEEAAEEAARVAGTHAAAAAAEAAKAERLSRARRQLSAEKARRETASAASAVAAAETESTAAARLRDEAKESLRELQAMEAEATKAERLARAKGGSQKLGVGKAQRLADLSGAIARLEDAAAAAEAEAQAAQARLEVARAARRARAAEELSELSLCSPLQPSPYKYGGAPLAQPTRGGGGDETMQAQVRWLARGGSSGESCGSDEALSPDRSPYASHYASHCDPTSKPPPTPARRLSLSAFGQRLLQGPRVVRASSSPAAVPARDGLLARVASRLRRSSSQKEAPTRAAVPQRLASFDDEMRA